MFGCGLIALVSALAAGHPAGEDTLLAVFWNVENFFDFIDGGQNPSDREFSSPGLRHWTKRRFYAKCNAVAKSIFWMAERYGRLPDVVGLAEVENRFVLERLLRATLLSKAGYRIVHYDSPDPRGIDVALLYRPATLRLCRSFPCPIRAGPSGAAAPATGGPAPPKGNPADSSAWRTRDILLVQLERAGLRYTVLVNHHPSKWGGTAAEGRRKAAIARLIALGDSLARAGDSLVVAMGDFNDTPENPLYGRLCREGRLVNLAESPARHGQGTIRYNGRWELIDQLYVSPALASAVCRTPSGQGMEILRIPFLLVRDAVHSGEKPFRTWSGPRYIGGVSDHLPVALQLRTPKESENDNRTQQPGRMPPG